MSRRPWQVTHSMYHPWMYQAVLISQSDCCRDARYIYFVPGTIFPTIRVVLSCVGRFEQSSPARRNDRVFLGFENTSFKPLSAQGERGRFPRVDGFSFGRWGVRQRRHILPLSPLAGCEMWSENPMQRVICGVKWYSFPQWSCKFSNAFDRTYCCYSNSS